MHVYVAWMILNHQKKVKVSFMISNEKREHNFCINVLKLAGVFEVSILWDNNRSLVSHSLFTCS